MKRRCRITGVHKGDKYYTCKIRNFPQLQTSLEVLGNATHDKHVRAGHQSGSSTNSSDPIIFDRIMFITDYVLLFII
ncbi:hypothetical protein STEG23_037184, partial [Scotinomys teguina]